MTVVEVKPAEQAAIQSTTTNALHAAAERITMPTGETMPPRYMDALSGLARAGRETLMRLGETSHRGGVAAFDLGDGDTQSGERIAAL